MTASLPVSVIIVSRGRPRALARAVLGVSQLYYDNFELIVVADPAGCAALRGLPEAAPAQVICFDRANISAARNLGLAQAGGEIVAFLDDDAVPEPSWLDHLVAPFSDPQVVAAGGFVRGRNGISFQWQADWVDHGGQTSPVSLSGDAPFVLHPKADRVAKTQGTNMALRRAALVGIGGFDERFRFFLDETDVNLRLAGPTAIVPLAQVHHGFLASAHRRADRVPRDLFEIGASWAVFLSTHCDPVSQAQVWAGVRAAERRRALRHMVSGGLEPRDVRHLMRRLDDGYAEGVCRVRPVPPAFDRPGFQRFPSRQLPDALHAGSCFARSRLDRAAARSRAQGQVTTVLCFSPTALYHHITFTEGGIWLHRGGLLGKVSRDDRVLQMKGARAQVEAHRNRLAKIRRI
ncbi:MAG: glycosyltransferase [Marinibacterium sp.]|nr:glycosyltransferase [Marinibacterium sp.]